MHQKNLNFWDSDEQKWDSNVKSFSGDPWDRHGNQSAIVWEVLIWVPAKSCTCVVLKNPQTHPIFFSLKLTEHLHTLKVTHDSNARAVSQGKWSCRNFYTVLHHQNVLWHFHPSSIKASVCIYIYIVYKKILQSPRFWDVGYTVWCI